MAIVLTKNNIGTEVSRDTVNANLISESVIIAPAVRQPHVASGSGFVVHEIKRVIDRVTSSSRDERGGRGKC